ncbi:MAG: MFS transporter [Clostridia bacterium]|nr:MFS transporter [Clostridia bacterium]
MGNIVEKDRYAFSRILYIIEASLEYFISLGVSFTYLPILGKAIGLSDGLIAIVEAFTSLGCSFQIFAIFLVKKKRVKPTVTIMHVISQTFFALVWFVPLFRFSKKAKIVLFVVLLILAHAIHNFINAPKINWYMSLVEDGKKGRFTATKEMVSLIGGMLFTFLYGAMINHFEAKGQSIMVFILCGGVLLFITLSHTLTLIFSKEKPIRKSEDDEKGKPLGVQLKNIIKDKTLLKVMIIPVLWNVVQYSITPFYAIYQRDVMLLNTGVISIITAVASIIRAVFSIPFGKYADKNSFSKMLNVCFSINIVALTFNLFSGFMIGGVLSIIAVCGYYFFYYTAMAGINSGVMNIIFDYVDNDKQMVALAFKSSVAGIVGFLTTVAFAPIVDFINSLKITLFNTQIYAQQILAVLGILLTLFIIIYNNKVVAKQKKTLLI